MKTLLRIILILILIIVTALAYFGFVPYISTFFGSTTPINLGINYSQKDYDNFVTKAKTELTFVDQNPLPDKSVSFTGKIKLEDSFSAEDVSSRINYAKWKYMPVSNVQLRINKDNTVEFSANLLTNRLEGFAKEFAGTNYTNQQIETALNFIQKIAPNPPVYAKFTASVINNRSSVAVASLQIGRFNVPLEKFGGNAAVMMVVDKIIQSVPGFYAETATFANGTLNFKGTVPQKSIVVAQ